MSESVAVNVSQAEESLRGCALQLTLVAPEYEPLTLYVRAAVPAVPTRDLGSVALTVAPVSMENAVLMNSVPLIAISLRDGLSSSAVSL